MVIKNVFKLARYELNSLRKEYKRLTAPMVKPNESKYRFSDVNEDGRIEYTITIEYEEDNDIIYFSVYQVAEDMYGGCTSDYSTKICYVEDNWFGDTKLGKWDMIVNDYERFISRVKNVIEEMNMLVG